jgi:hypothetical protein
VRGGGASGREAEVLVDKRWRQQPPADQRQAGDGQEVVAVPLLPPPGSFPFAVSAMAHICSSSWGMLYTWVCTSSHGLPSASSSSFKHHCCYCVSVIAKLMLSTFFLTSLCCG